MTLLITFFGYRDDFWPFHVLRKYLLLKKIGTNNSLLAQEKLLAACM
jgi:hypothetical protein